VGKGDIQKLKMQAACQELEKQFARCSSDLDFIAAKLDEDFEGNKAYARVSHIPVFLHSLVDRSVLAACCFWRLFLHRRALQQHETVVMISISAP
jgi:hypothetical protein